MVANPLEPPPLFRRRTAEPELGYTIATILRRYIRPIKGEIGIEIEVEGNKFPKPEGCEGSHTAVPMPGSTFWKYVHDGSLRGEDNAEYVLAKPIQFAEVEQAVAELRTTLETYGSVLSDSNRTSVHVHLNVQDFHLNRLASFIALYLCFEEVLTEWCGDHRVGNLFCLRGKDAPAAVTKIKKFIQNDGKTELNDGLHYAGLNTSALKKFGSVEIRTLRGPTDLSFAQLLVWVKILERLYKLSAEYPDPRDIPGLFSQQGPIGFFESVLGDLYSVVLQGISFNDQQLRDSMYEGIRLAQDICFCRDWSAYKTVSTADDPFGRAAARTTSGAASSGLAHVLEQLYGDMGANSPSPPSAPLGALQQLYVSQAMSSPPVTAYSELPDEEFHLADEEY